MCHSALHDGFGLLPQELFAGGLQPMNQDLSDTLHQFVTKIAVTLSGDHEMGAVQDDCSGGFQSARLEVPDERREQP